MVQRTVWYDDLALQKDEEVPASVRDFTFMFEGQEYTIDLTHENADKLRAIFLPYKAAGRRAGTAASVVQIVSRRATGNHTAVRDWCKRWSLQINERGRIPAAVLEAYARRDITTDAPADADRRNPALVWVRQWAPAATTAPAPAPVVVSEPEPAPVLTAVPEPEPEPVTIPVFSAPADVPADEPPLSPGAAALREQRGGATPAEIRAWAAKVGLTVSVRGRIAAAAAEAYMHRDPETEEPSVSDVNNPDLEWTNAARKAARAKIKNGTAFAQREHAATPEGYDVALKAWAKSKGIPIPTNGKLSPSVRERFSNETGLLPPAHAEQATG